MASSAGPTPDATNIKKHQVNLTMGDEEDADIEKGEATYIITPMRAKM